MLYLTIKKEKLGRSTMTEILKNRDKRCGGNSE
jgi:hypothetical protein